MFSMFIDPNEDSKIQLGGYDLNKYAKGPINWYPINAPGFWELSFRDVKMGNVTFEPSVKSLMADTGTSLNMIPDEDYYKIFDKFIKDEFSCHILPNTLHSCDCTLSQQQAIPDIDFQIGNETYSIPRDKWFERSGNQCVIKFMHGPHKDYWILGLNFFENYYTVFDYENMAIGFADSINYGKALNSASFIDWATGKMPMLMNLEIVGQNHTERMVFALIGGAAIILFTVYFCIMRKSKNKVRAQVEQNEFLIVENINNDDALSSASNTF